MIGSSALQAAQTAENIVGNNIANANTPDYSDETANLENSTPYTPADGSTILQPGMLGTGVTVGSVTRATDAFTTLQLRDAYGDESYSNAQENTLNAVQSAFNEPSTSGLGNAISTFFSSFQDLSTDPSDSGVRATVIENGAAMAQVFNSTAQQLSDINSGVTTQLNTDISQLNTYGTQIASLNVQIAQSLAQGQNPNELEDQRDSLLDSVSKLGNININTQSNGMVNVSVGNTNFVMGSTASTVTLSSLQSNGSLTSGEIAGLVSAQASTQSYQSSLDTLAGQIVSAVNNAQYGGTDLYGNTGSSGSNPATPFFTTSGTTAGTISVSAAMQNDPNLLALGAAGTPGTPADPGDGTNIANFTAVASTSMAGLDNQSPTQYYQSMISNIGAVTAAATTASTNSTATVQQLQTQKDSVTGVSTDNEMINMMQYQEMYQAAAKYISTSDDMLNTLITGMFSSS